MAKKEKSAKGKNPMNSTQVYLRIAEIRDDTVLLKNGGVRAVLRTTSINFNLKSEQEQNSIIAAYQGFLNSLEFPIQILVRSKKLDLDDYVDQIRKLAEKQENKLLQEQTYEYAEYVKKLVDYADIMEKEFFVIVPYDKGGSSPDSMNFIQSFFQRLSPKDKYSEMKKRQANFDKLQKALNQRVNVVQSGLESCGLKVEMLQTADLVELFYKSLNPISSRTSKLKNIDETSIRTDEHRVEEDKRMEQELKTAQK